MALYESWGFRVIPLVQACPACLMHPEGASKCKACRGGKRPAYVDWPTYSRPFLPRHNVGIVTGKESGGLVVLDFDDESLARELLRCAPEDLARETTVQRTPRPGWHVMGIHANLPSGRPIKGMDVRGEHGQVVAAPSLHANGRSWELLRPTPPALLTSFAPPDLLAHLATTSRSNTNTAPRLGVKEAPFAPEEADMELVEGWIMSGSPPLLAHWGVLNGERGRPPGEEGGRSRSDWVVALALAEFGMSEAQIAWVLLQMPGSKAAERGARYACLTARNAVHAKRPEHATEPKGVA